MSQRNPPLLITCCSQPTRTQDPNVLESRVLISACGHDGPFGASGVKRLQSLGMVPKVAAGMGVRAARARSTPLRRHFLFVSAASATAEEEASAIVHSETRPPDTSILRLVRSPHQALDMNKAEDSVVRNTREVVPGMILAGMEVAELDGSPRMGPTFGAMLLSGQKAAYLALQSLGMKDAADKSIHVGSHMPGREVELSNGVVLGAGGSAAPVYRAREVRGMSRPSPGRCLCLLLPVLMRRCGSGVRSTNHHLLPSSCFAGVTAHRRHVQQPAQKYTRHD